MNNTNCKQCAALSLRYRKGNFTLCFKNHISPKSDECPLNWSQEKEMHP